MAKSNAPKTDENVKNAPINQNAPDEPTANGTAVGEFDDPNETGDTGEFDGTDGADDPNGEGVPASQTAAATAARLSASLPPDARPAKPKDGKKAIAVRLGPELQKRVRVRAMVAGVTPGELIAQLIETHVKEVVISDK